MKITAIRVYRVVYTVPEVDFSAGYRFGRDIAINSTPGAIIAVETDVGLVGYGEACPAGPTYAAAFTEGVFAGLGIIAPRLLGANPLELEAIWLRMNAALKGHAYVKSALDIACWDLLGKASGLSLSTLLGGRLREEIPLFWSVPHSSPLGVSEQILGVRERGYSIIQLKSGRELELELECAQAASEALGPGGLLMVDANTSWRADEALRFARGVDRLGLDLYIEQPCASYEACRSVRRRISQPFKLDESIVSVQALVRALADEAVDMVSIKPSRVGGISPSRKLRDLCVEAGIPVDIEDTWGGPIAVAAAAHLCASTPERLLVASYDLTILTGAPRPGPARPAGMSEASLSLPDGPGLGVTPALETLGAPVEIYR